MTLDAGLAAYLTTNRDFCAPAICAAVAALDLPAGARVLDVGTGAGGALRPLAAAVGPGGSVLGVDLDPDVAALAAGHADGLPEVEVRSGDALKVIATGEFDAVWASDVVWPGNFADPRATVAALLAGLRSGGTLALLSSGYYHASFLPGHARLELLVRLASFRRWHLPVDGPQHHDRHLSWLVAAGATDTAIRVFPRVGFPGDPELTAYLDGTVWPELRRSAAAHGRDVGLTDADLAQLTVLTTPGGPHDITAESGFHVVQPVILTTGRRPA